MMVDGIDGRRHGKRQESTRYSSYLEGYWPCSGGLSALNAIGTLLSDMINSGLTLYDGWRYRWTPARKAGGTP